MFKINLVPESKQQVRKIQKMNLAITASVIGVVTVLLIVILTLQGIKISKQSTSKRLTKNIEKTNDELKDYAELEKTVVSLQKGLEGVKSITSTNPRWAFNFFKEIEKATPQEVSFEGLDIKDGKISADLVGKNIDSLSKFVDSFSTHKVTAITDKVDGKPTGEYDAAKKYLKGDLVEYNSNVYIAKEESTGKLPTDKVFWEQSGINLFKNIDVSGYTKGDGDQVKFSVKMDLVKEALDSLKKEEL